MQLHARAALSLVVGLVWTSRERMAESRAERAVEAPCIGVPPVIFTLVCFGAGDEVRDVGLLLGFLVGLRSDISVPAADGGARGVGA
jgi:hypothetical protein